MPDSTEELVVHSKQPTLQMSAEVSGAEPEHKEQAKMPHDPVESLPPNLRDTDNPLGEERRQEEAALASVEVVPGSGIRTEEQKMLMQDIDVTLGGDEYRIKVLAYLPAQDWKREFSKIQKRRTSGSLEIKKIADKFAAGDGGDITPDQTKRMMEFSQSIVTDSVPDCWALLVSYCQWDKDAERDWGNIATEGEIVLAFEAISQVAFPHLRAITALAIGGQVAAEDKPARAKPSTKAPVPKVSAV